MIGDTTMNRFTTHIARFAPGLITNRKTALPVRARYRQGTFVIRAILQIGVVVATVIASVPPAAAQWARVTGVPASDVFSVWANGDTIVAGASTSVYVSTDAGATWRPSSTPAAGVTSVQAVRIRDGRLYAGTFGQGVFVSDDLGDTWQAFNQGLVGGVLNSQLDLSDFAVRGDSLYAATLGAGVYVRSLVGTATWSHFGDEFEPNQSSNVNSLALGNARLLAMAGPNGTVFVRDPGDPDWTLSWLDNVGLDPGLQAQSASWTGSGWVVATNVGVFRSTDGDGPWTFSSLGLGGLLQSSFATMGQHLFAAFDIVNAAVIEHSGDNGVSWQVLESLPGAFVYKLAASGTDLYAGRGDGLWRRSTVTVSVEDGRSRSLRFALAGPRPVRNVARFHFELPETGSATIEVFDVAGHRVSSSIRGSWSAGAHEVSWNTRELAAGVYEARLTAGGRNEVIRMVHVR
jgi:hypothetical protein